MPMMLGTQCRNAEEVAPTSPFSAREYAKALNLLLQLYNVALNWTWAERKANHNGGNGTCVCELCKTFRAVHSFIYHGEG